MAVLKCKMCGGDLTMTKGVSVAECEYCGSVQTVPKADDEKKLTLFARANRLRAGCEFDKAAGVYETIVADFPEEAEAYWGLVLCRYGIEYVDDPATGKKIPTCHRAGFESMMEDADLAQVLAHADEAARRVYMEEANVIEALRKGIIEVSGKEAPYDIFICYKESDDTGSRTMDSVLAQDLYDALTEKGYRVFFSRISLEDKLGREYEPYIFAALHSAAIMLVIGTDYDHYNAVWVRNEWSRYLKLMAQDKSKHLIPCYKGIDAYDMPKEFSKLQAQDLGKMGATQDVIRGVEKLLPKEKPEIIREVVVQQMGAGVDTAPLLKRAFLFLEDGDWTSANEYCEKVLDADPECAEAYVVKLMAQLQVRRQEQLAELPARFDENRNYEKALRYAEPSLKKALAGYIEQIETRNEQNRLKQAYAEAKAELDKGSAGKTATPRRIEVLKKAVTEFEALSGYSDADEQADAARRLLQTQEKALKKKKKRNRWILGITAAALVLAAAGTMLTVKVIVPAVRYGAAEKALIAGEYDTAISGFAALEGYKDAADREKEAVYAKAMALLESGSYEEAAEIFETISGYDDAKEMQKEAFYRLAEELMANEQWDAASPYYDRVDDYKDSKEKKLVCRLEAVKILIGEKEYTEAIARLERLRTYDEAAALLRECYLVVGTEAYEQGKYTQAMKHLEKVTDRDDAVAAMLDEATYQYLLGLSTPGWNQNDNHRRAKALKEKNYKDIAQVWQEKFAWKAEFIAVNTASEDETTDMSSISVFDPVYFHFRLAGGEPGAEMTPRCRFTLPTGYVGEYAFDSAYQSGSVLWYGWERHIYKQPGYGVGGGQLIVQVLDESGNVIGEDSVNMVS